MDPLVEHHYHNIANGKAVKNEDGTLSTVRGAIVELDGIQTLIPTIWDGKEVDIQTATENAIDSGVNWQRAFGDTAVDTLREIEIENKEEMLDTTTPEEAQAKLDEWYASLEDKPSGAMGFAKDLGKLGFAGAMLGAEKLGIDTSPLINWYIGGDTGFALGGVAAKTKGITTEEGLNMAQKTFIMDDKKADTNGDGELSTREREIGKAVQRNVDDDVTKDDKVKAYKGGYGHKVKAASGGYACSCGAKSSKDCKCGYNSGGMPCGCSSVQDCSCNMMGGLMGYDDVSGNPIPIGSSPENVRDDIDAKLSTDEYVLPAHVVKWHGLKHIQRMQSEAEMGLMSMHMEGLIHHVDQEEPDSKGVEDTEVSDEDYSEQEETPKTPETQEDVSSEDISIEIAAVEVDDMLDDIEGVEELFPETSKLPGMVKKQKVAFL